MSLNCLRLIVNHVNEIWLFESRIDFAGKPGYARSFPKSTGALKNYGNLGHNQI